MITNNKDCFRLQKEKIIEKANKMANLVPAIIHRSSNKLLIGKTFWKNVALPKFLFATTVIPVNQAFMQKLQIIENKAFRLIFHAAKGTPISTLRGEIGSSLMCSRVEKNKLIFLKHLFNSNNQLLKNVVKSHLDEKRSPWAKEASNLLTRNNLTSESLKSTSKDTISKWIRERDHNEWKQNIEGKTSLSLYRKFKGKLKEENIYSNNYGSVLLFKCRTNTLNLNDRNRFVGGSTECPGCKCSREDLLHFLLECPLYSNIRGEFTQLQQPYIEETDEILARLLLFYEQPLETQLEVQRYLCRIYHKRGKLLEE